MAYNESIKRLPDPFHNNGLGFLSGSAKGVSKGTSHALNGGSTVSALYQGGYWEIDISYPETLQHELDTVLPFLESLEGSFSTFYIMLPQHRHPKTGPWNTSSDYLIAKGDIIRTGRKTMKIGNWSARGGDLSVGDMIKFTNMGKIYKITDASYNSSTDEKTIEINTDLKYPSLLDVAGFEPNDILFQVSLKDNNTPGPTLQPNGIYSGFSVSMRENVREIV